jgi:hypothetical protein
MPDAESLLPSRIPDLRYADALPALALRAKFLVHMTIIPQGHSLVPYRDFGYRNIALHESRVYGIPDIPIPDAPLPCVLALRLHRGPCDLHLCDRSPNSCRDSGFPITKIRRILNPETPISDFAICLGLN